MRKLVFVLGIQIMCLGLSAQNIELHNKSGFELENIIIYLTNNQNHILISNLGNLSRWSSETLELSIPENIRGDFGYELTFESIGKEYKSSFGYGPDNKDFILVISNNYSLFNEEYLDTPYQGTFAMVYWRK
jgi:hypothetical protein